ncbi:SMP-30/gluconolactonase/LRE family protein [Fontimonas sp. SYSU GA230001]|uniref:strictosidine synthase family protein n=1 Tax=Fontimonas sp. SYSU GA230001 TaxID=3142450 RepID=UPI0032B329D0
MRLLGYLVLPLGLVVAYLLFWPVPIEPRAWTPQPLADGAYPYNETLKAVERLAEGVGRGPEGIAVDAAGRIYAGYDDGRVMMFNRNGSGGMLLADTGGRPLGLSFGPRGGVLVADAVKGLLLVGGQGAQQLLAVEAEGVPFRFVDDVDNTRMTHKVYFTDASSKFAWPDTMADVMEHGANGRLLEYDFDTDKTTVLLRDLYFANGVAVGPDDAYVLVSETTKYRVRRYWLKGEKAGTSDIFIDNLPGFPDNLSYNDKGQFWLALYAPRTAALDALLPKPDLRRIVFRLPDFLQPGPAHHGWVLGLDLDGKVVANLQYKGRGAYAPITSVEQHGDALYLGSLTDTAIGRLPLSAIQK